MGFLKTAVKSWLGLTPEALKPLADKEQLQKVLMNRMNSPKSDMEEFWIWYTGTAYRLANYYKARLQVKVKQDYFY